MSFFIRYKQLCELNNISPSAFALSIGISKTSVSRWKNGAVPNTDILTQIAKKFNVSTDYLLGNEQKEKSSPQLSDKDLIALELFNQLQDEQKEIIIKLASQLIDNRK